MYCLSLWELKFQNGNVIILIDLYSVVLISLGQRKSSDGGEKIVSVVIQFYFFLGWGKGG